MHDQTHTKLVSNAHSHDGIITESELLSIREVDGMFRVRLSGGDLRVIDSKQLRAQIARLHAPDRPPAVLFSLRGAQGVSSGCIGTFAQLSSDLERVGGVLVLYNIPREISKVLKKTKLDRIVTTAKTRPHARKKAISTQKRIMHERMTRAA